MALLRGLGPSIPEIFVRLEPPSWLQFMKSKVLLTHCSVYAYSAVKIRVSLNQG